MHLTFILTQVMVVSLLPPLTGVGSYNFIQLAWKEMEKAKGFSAPGRKGHCSRSSNSWSGAVPLRVSKGFAGWGGWRHFYKVGEIKIFNSLS